MRQERHTKHAPDLLDATTRWEALLSDLERAFDVRITVHDMLGLLRDARDQLLITGRHLHPHPVCQRRVARPPTSQRCSAYCVTEVNARALLERSAFAGTCWKGVREVVVPIFREGALALVLFAGAFRDPAKRGPSRARFGAKIADTWRALPELDDARFATLSRLLFTIGTGVLAEAEELIAGSAEDRRARILLFVHRHAHEAVKLADLARVLHLSASRASHAVGELFGMSFKQLIVRERLRRAQVLLKTSALSAAEIARRTGFGNPCYFSRLFRERVGVTPGAYRRDARIVSP